MHANIWFFERCPSQQMASWRKLGSGGGIRYRVIDILCIFPSFERRASMMRGITLLHETTTELHSRIIIMISIYYHDLIFRARIFPRLQYRVP